MRLIAGICGGDLMGSPLRTPLCALLVPAAERKAAAGGVPRGWLLFPASKSSLPTRRRPGPMRLIAGICGTDPLGSPLRTSPATPLDPPSESWG